MIDKQRPRRIAAVAVALVLILPSWSGEAHEIPADVTVQAFVKPEPEHSECWFVFHLWPCETTISPLVSQGIWRYLSPENMVLEAADVWIVDYVSILENEEPLGRAELAAVRVAIPGDRAFRSWESAYSNVLSAPLVDGIQLPARQAMVDVLLEWSITSESSDFSIVSGLNRPGIRTVTVLRFLPPGDAEGISVFGRSVCYDLILGGTKRRGDS